MEIQRELKTPCFSLLHLPFVAMKHVLQCMDSTDLLRTAFVSKRMGRYTKLATARIKLIEIEFTNNRSTINLLDFGCLVESYKDKDIMREKKNENDRNYSLMPWINMRNGSILENTAKISNLIRNTFECSNIDLVIAEDVLPKKTEEILEMFQQYRELTYKPRSITTTALNKIMDSANLQHFLNIAAEIPKDFNHKNKFKFDNAQYQDATWIKLEDILNMENVRGVQLVRNNFTQSQVNTLLKRWLASDIDMFYWFILELNDGIEITEVLDELLTFKFRRDAMTIDFTLAKTTSSFRERQILVICRFERYMVLTGWRTDKVITECGEDIYERDDIYDNAYNILKLLKRKQEIDTELEKNDLELATRRRLVEDVKKLVAELEEMHVIFENEQAFVI
ncbi:hypothetical protein CRE_13250 [Caenorhabditis remanei]|uniref:F-box domain-containing protein n=1 Tax=Caenorhabditis remanei TaxID=31234 RepID=E3M8B0_CAERE|nr:hypothetical protein CRE_13250 [Caenorhabditis remanei]